MLSMDLAVSGFYNFLTNINSSFIDCDVTLRIQIEWRNNGIGRYDQVTIATTPGAIFRPLKFHCSWTELNKLER